MIGLAFFTSLYASTMDRPLCRIMYAMAIVALRDTPAWQCTSTLLPAFRASSARKQNDELGNHAVSNICIGVTTSKSVVEFVQTLA